MSAPLPSSLLPLPSSRGPRRLAGLASGLLFLSGLGLGSGGCGESDPMQGSLAQNVGSAFAPCNAAEIRFLATKHNVMTAFEPCGNNNFQHYAWSPDGRHLYFQLVLISYVMNAEAKEKPVLTVPTTTPIGPAAWLSASRLAIPTGPAEGQQANRVVLYDIEQRTLFEHPLPGVTEVHATSRASDPSELLLLTSGAQGERRLQRLDTADGTLSQAFPFIDGPIDTFTYTPQVDALTVGRGEEVTLYLGATGEIRGVFAPATRGSVHPDGRWLALEHSGDPISIFYQRSWDELPERAREREIARARRFEEQMKLQGKFETEVQPPTLSFLDLTTGKRRQLSSVYGHTFHWYEPTAYYGSFILWGFEGKEFKRNVMLGNMHDRLRTIERDGTMLGVEPMDNARAERLIHEPMPSVRAPAEALSEP